MNTSTQRVVARFKLAVNLDHATNWFINVLDELGHDDDPEEDLASVIRDPAAAKRIWKGFSTMTPQEERSFHQALREDEEAVREWIEKWLHGR